MRTLNESVYMGVSKISVGVLECVGKTCGRRTFGIWYDARDLGNIDTLARSFALREEDGRLRGGVTVSVPSAPLESRLGENPNNLGGNDGVRFELAAFYEVVEEVGVGF